MKKRNMKIRLSVKVSTIVLLYVCISSPAELVELAAETPQPITADKDTAGHNDDKP